jgi:hypothetical protein
MYWGKRKSPSLRLASRLPPPLKMTLTLVLPTIPHSHIPSFIHFSREGKSAFLPFFFTALPSLNALQFSSFSFSGLFSRLFNWPSAALPFLPSTHSLQFPILLLMGQPLVFRASTFAFYPPFRPTLQNQPNKISGSDSF